MIEWIRKATLAGIGALTLTEERAKRLVEELVEQGKMSREEGEAFVRDMMTKTEASRREWEEQIRKSVKETFRKMDLVPRQDLDALEAQLRKLEHRVAELERRERDRSEEVPV